MQVRQIKAVGESANCGSKFKTITYILHLFMKHIYLLLLILVCSLVSSFAQTNANDSVRSDTIVLQKGEVFTVVEQMPEFPGGISEMTSFISSNIKYPVEGEKNGVEGKVIGNFIVEKDGTFSELKVIKSLAPEFDNEVLRVIQLMPNWIPGKMNGRNVRVKMSIPINFVLPKKKK